MRANLFSAAYVISNVGAIIILLLSIWYKKAGTILVALLFLAAALINAWQAIYEPDRYNIYELVAALPVYEYFIRDVFLIHIKLYILILMVFQLLVGLSILYNKKWSIVVAGIYLLALAPLGAGSSFPCSVILAAACMVLFFK
ncbi:hypothetical protein [Chitinophaga sancti]|uniref:Uncharacterized protein n=1 Tax=Chitinophaga sancti TaxID=1004 RepID=A0A1K1SLH2_9BACT|nr:hypothetical protein [Chitinophaga sancti]WQD63881.1 hypothetical protein U0033_05695 [Chitinophaga sancti]WQG90494.1 hypothetical protein SR876_03225 [Chitinophaga sancti]SFW85272.1 hypothetical protein SAMN05661012_05694 [Chitinophaga sancti]